MMFALTGMLASPAACGGGGGTDAGGGSGSSGTGAATAAPAGRSSAPRSARTYHVALEMLGKGRVNAILYHLGTDSRAANVMLPWKAGRTVRGGDTVALLASASSNQRLTCRIVVNGKVVSHSTGEVAQCRYPLPK